MPIELLTIQIFENTDGEGLPFAVNVTCGARQRHSFDRSPEDALLTGVDYAEEFLLEIEEARHA